MKLHTLDTIRLARFIDLWLGDVDAVVAEGEATDEQKQRAALDLCNQYMEIVGGTQVQARLAQEKFISPGAGRRSRRTLLAGWRSL